MERDLLKDLIEWRHRKIHLPLLLRGARQVGKTYLIEHFGNTYFKNLHQVNFELHPEYKESFTELAPAQIIKSLELMLDQNIVPGESLLFLDEVQECPQAIMALRYFKEQMPDLHVIAAGSLLEFALTEAGLHMPVGRVQFMYLRPLSFREFLHNHGHPQLGQLISEANFSVPIPPMVHQKLLKLVKEYMVLGGMPAVHQSYLLENNWRYCQTMQTAILNTYRLDFGKYASIESKKYLEKVFYEAPNLIGQQVKYVAIAQNMRSRDLKIAIENLQKAGVLCQVMVTQASGLPLNSTVKPKKFKLIFLDVGLANRISQIDILDLLRDETIFLHRGAISEQFVGQEFLAYEAVDQEPELFFWVYEQPGSMAEIDYVLPFDGQVIPVEVKSSHTGRLKSLQLFMQQKKSSLGIKVSQQPLERMGKIVSLPFYLLSEWRRLLKLCI